MAKRKSDVLVEPVIGGYRVCLDKAELDRVRDMPGVHQVSSGPDAAGWRKMFLDPRYDADEVIAEIEALGEPEKPKRAAWERAYGLGKEAGAAATVVEVGLDYLKGAEYAYKEPERYEKVLWALQRAIVNRLEWGRW